MLSPGGREQEPLAWADVVAMDIAVRLGKGRVASSSHAVVALLSSWAAVEGS